MHELRQALAEPTYVDGHGLALSISIGVVNRPAQDSEAADLLRELPGLAHRAGAEVIVDGLTTAERARFWLAAGAELALGDHCGAPCRPDELAAAFGGPGWRTPS